jgi:hypothetical protein
MQIVSSCRVRYGVRAAEESARIEFGDHVASYDSGKGTRHNLAAMAVWQLCLSGL